MLIGSPGKLHYLVHGKCRCITGRNKFTSIVKWRHWGLYLAHPLLSSKNSIFKLWSTDLELSQMNLVISMTPGNSGWHLAWPFNLHTAILPLFIPLTLIIKGFHSPSAFLGNRLLALKHKYDLQVCTLQSPSWGSLVTEDLELSLTT